MEILGYMPIVWTVLFVIFIIIEAVTLSLTSLWFAVAAVFAFASHYLGLGLYGQIGLFLVLSGLLILVARPFAKKRLKIGGHKTNVTALSGSPAVVTKMIPAHQSGQVRLQGQIWTARSTDENLPIDEGTDVIVERIQGVTAYVTPSKEK